jgi:hypothetical protein
MQVLALPLPNVTIDESGGVLRSIIDQCRSMDYYAGSSAEHVGGHKAEAHLSDHTDAKVILGGCPASNGSEQL